MSEKSYLVYIQKLARVIIETNLVPVCLKIKSDITYYMHDMMKGGGVFV